MAKELDIVIVGAGVGGIGAASWLRRLMPEKQLVVLEKRANPGGTWDLFRYPGVRSDSDMLTYGYSFSPWQGEKVLSPGADIQDYLRQVIDENQLDQQIRFGCAVKSASWCSNTKRWTLAVETQGEKGIEHSEYKAPFVLFCTGYFRYDQGYLPDYPGVESFSGELLHPQQWPEQASWEGKRVVVIGSGATAVTLVPAMAERAASVTMLQRSPTFFFSVPLKDRMLRALKLLLPNRWAVAVARQWNIFRTHLLYRWSRVAPRSLRWLLLRQVRRQVGGAIQTAHFTPSYNPWDERLCAVPDNDLFKNIAAGKASVVTDNIECFTPNGIRLESGRELAADIVVSATGLNLRLLGDIAVTVDGQPLPLCERMLYKSTMIEGVPNAAVMFGYINASWTLKVDIVSRYLFRLFKYMQDGQHTVVVPKLLPSQRSEDCMMSALQAGYVRRAERELPRQGLEYPWVVTMDYPADKKMLTTADINDGLLQFD